MKSSVPGVMKSSVTGAAALGPPPTSTAAPASTAPTPTLTDLRRALMRQHDTLAPAGRRPPQRTAPFDVLHQEWAGRRLSRELSTSASRWR